MHAITPHIVVGDLPEDKSAEIRIVPIDGNGVTITGFYDFVNALPKLVKFFLNFDPRPTLTKVKCPVLAVNGEKDLQVPCKENLAGIDPLTDALVARG